jgi:hypothetical protein
LSREILVRWYPGTAQVPPDDYARERARDGLPRRLLASVVNAPAVRVFGTELLTVRIDLDE